VKTLIVVDALSDLPQLQSQAIEFVDYLANYPKLSEPKTRVINLCDTELYLSKGYYCSLLAEARQHQVMPSVAIINDLIIADKNQPSMTLALPQNLVSELKSKLVFADNKTVSFDVYFGLASHLDLQPIAKWIFKRFVAPILTVDLIQKDNSTSAVVSLKTISDLSDEQKEELCERLSHFTQTVWKARQSKKKTRWDMAILVNPDEANSPSDSKAIRHFVKAAHKVGIHAEVVTAEQITHLAQYDALFIRETTSINHQTYRLAKQAESLGLVVIDDAQSILRCCNKVFLQDAFSYHKVPAPKSDFVSSVNEQVCDDLEAAFSYPMVLKLPESSFSLGVFKVKDRKELFEKLEAMLLQSALVLVQEYIFTEYDWRIGLLNGKPIYACRYFMARNHWQIYNHGGKKTTSGGFETLPTFEVPKIVLDAAVKAGSTVGKGLYGVDIKHLGNQTYVIEVNDNPSIDSDVEDKYLGKELYMLIMQEFASRLEARGR